MDTTVTVAGANLRPLRGFLGFSALVWGVSWVGAFLPWPTAVVALQGLGAREIPADPMLDYWLRMASGAFGLVGMLYALVAWKPVRYAVIIPVLGWLMLLEGAMLLVHGARLGLPPFPFVADVSACLLGGMRILRTAGRALPAWANPQVELDLRS